MALVVVCAGCQFANSNPRTEYEDKKMCTRATEYKLLDDVSRARTDVLMIDVNAKFIFETIEWNNGQLSFVSAKLIRKIKGESKEVDCTNYFYSHLSGEYFPSSMKGHEILLRKISSGALISRKKFENLFSGRSCEKLYSQFVQ